MFWEDDLSYSNFTKKFRELTLSDFSVLLNTASGCASSERKYFEHTSLDDGSASKTGHNKKAEAIIYKRLTNR